MCLQTAARYTLTLTSMEAIQKASKYLREQIGDFTPQVGIVLGSGLGKLAEQIQQAQRIPYRDIPGFPLSTASGHKGNLIFGKLGGKNVVAMQRVCVQYCKLPTVHT